MTHALVTGGARGLGRAMVDHLTAAGVQVTVVDIDCSPLDGLDRVQCIPCDLTKIPAIGSILPRLSSPVDILVHAAGISATGPFEDIPWDHQRAVWSLNFEAPVRLTQALLFDSQLSWDAKLCFVSSLSSFVGYPGAASYAGSKDGLTSYARCLAKAPVARDMSVTVAFPGPLRTEHAARYAPDNSAASIARRMAPNVAAGLILKDVGRGKTTSLPGGAAKVMAVLGRIAPGLTQALMRKVIFEKIEKVRV